MLKAYAVALVMTTATPAADKVEKAAKEQTKAKATSAVTVKKEQPKLEYIRIGSIRF